MSDKSESGKLHTIERVFDLLDGWRHLPAYQLERRADTFFALFLPEVLTAYLSEQNFSVKVDPTLIPEFPIKKERNNQSKNVDYFALSQDRKHAFLIELKTDMESLDRQREQDRVGLLKDKTMTQIVGDLKAIAMSDSVRSNKQTRAKYFRLFHELNELGLIEIPNRDDLEKLIPPRQMRKSRYDEIYKEVKVIKRPSVDVVYVVPICDTEHYPVLRDVRCIDFLYFANYAKKGGAIGRRFAKSLREWKKPAGLSSPQ